jgi:hypothetical protein
MTRYGLSAQRRAGRTPSNTPGQADHPPGRTEHAGLAHPGLGEREVTQALLERDHHLVRAWQVILADKGFAGRDFEAFITGDLQAHLIRPDRKDEPPRFGKLARQRQWIEAIIDTLKGQLTLEDHGGRTMAGVCPVC